MRMMILKSVFLPASLFPALSAGLPGCVSKQSTVRPSFHRLGQQSLTSSRKPGLFRSRVRGSRRALQRSLEPGQGRRGPPPGRPHVQTLAKHVVGKHGSRGSGEPAVRTGTWQHVPAWLPRVKTRDCPRGACAANSWELPFPGGLAAASRRKQGSGQTDGVMGRRRRALPPYQPPRVGARPGPSLRSSRSPARTSTLSSPGMAAQSPRRHQISPPRRPRSSARAPRWLTPQDPAAPAPPETAPNLSLSASKPRPPRPHSRLAMSPPILYLVTTRSSAIVCSCCSSSPDIFRPPLLQPHFP